MERSGSFGKGRPAWWHRLLAVILDHWFTTMYVALGLLALHVGASHAQVQPSQALPHGILTLEFLGTRSHAIALLSMLGEAARAEIRAAIHADFVLIVGYTMVLWLAINALNARWPAAPAAATRLHRLAPRAPWIAGVFDVLENIGILLFINQSVSERIGLLAAGITLAAWIKWVFVLYAVGYLAIAVVGWQRNHWSGKRSVD